MGTRGAVGFKIQGKYKVWYNHFDSYPKGLGKEVVDFVNTVQDWDAIGQKVIDLEVIYNQDERKPTEEEKEYYKDFSNHSVSTESSDDWYCLLYETQGASALHHIRSGKLKHIVDCFSFLANSLWCEYAYIINLDELRLEFYEGFNKEYDDKSPLAKHFPRIVNSDRDIEVFDKESLPYQPVAFKGSFPLSKKISKNWESKIFKKEKEA